MQSPKGLSERKLLFVIGAVQFVNILDFVMVMPLGPDLARELGMRSSDLGLVGGSYTAAAAVSGLVGSLFLDRFDRRSALAVALVGLVLATASGGLAVDLPTLLASRVGAGIFGGPATAISLAIISDAVPVERRGRAMGAVMGAFSLASVLGIPAGLELARVGGWQLPFFAVAGLGAVIILLVLVSLPPFRAHLAARESSPADDAADALSFLKRPTFLLAFGASACAMVSGFLIVPNISAYVQMNLGYPRDRLFLLYLIGGGVSFITMRISGALSDRLGPAPVAALGCALFCAVIYLAFIQPVAGIPIILLFSGFMICSTWRMVPMQALSSRVPNGRERARFMSSQAAVQHVSSASGAYVSSQLLSVDAHGALLGMPRVAWLSIGFTILMPVLLYGVQVRLKAIARPLAQAA
ncbi:MAG: Arabinose efflux permease [Myxococcaceae bacterium]|nr:Arabinose efflux permease [Myxococcaceae bacterium]